MKYQYINRMADGVLVTAIIAFLGLFSVAMAGGNLGTCLTCGTPATVDALVGAPQYEQAEQEVYPETTKAFSVPPGFKLVEVNHPDEIICTARPVPSTWTLRPVVRRTVAKKAVVTAAQAEMARRLKEAAQ